MGMTAMLPSKASGRSKGPLSRDTAAICSTVHPSTEAQRTAAISTSFHLSSNDDNSVTTHTQSITTGVLPTAWSMWDAAANTANWILGSKWYCKPRRQNDGKWFSISEWY